MVRVGVIDKNGQDWTSKTRQSKMQYKTQDKDKTKTRQDIRKTCLGINQSQRQGQRPKARDEGDGEGPYIHKR
jgi:hypothetical protein